MEFRDKAKACWDAIRNSDKGYDDVDPFSNLCEDFQCFFLAQVFYDVLEKQCDKIRSSLSNQYRRLNMISATTTPFDSIKVLVPSLPEQLP